MLPSQNYLLDMFSCVCVTNVSYRWCIFVSDRNVEDGGDDLSVCEPDLSVANQQRLLQSSFALSSGSLTVNASMSAWELSVCASCGCSG